MLKFGIFVVNKKEFDRNVVLIEFLLRIAVNMDNLSNLYLNI